IARFLPSLETGSVHLIPTSGWRKPERAEMTRAGWFTHWRIRWAIPLIAALFICALLPILGQAQETGAAQPYGIAAKRPVLQAACQYCPWGALADIVKKTMAPYGYDVAVCYSCSGVNSVRIVSRRLVGPEISDRQFAEGTVYLPDGPIDFGITQADRVRAAYEGT